MDYVPDNGNWRIRGEGQPTSSSAGSRLEELASDHGGGPAPEPQAGNSQSGEQRNERRAEGLEIRNRGRTCIRLASLNMRGAGPECQGGIGEKWMRINQILRENRIAVLALQETHLNDTQAAAVNALFGEYLHVFHSPYPQNETGACGVAFVINRRILKNMDCTLDILVPGRAIALTLQWPMEKRVRLANVYAPNDTAANASFWEQLRAMREMGNPIIDVLMGDYNIVEDPIDRLPTRQDDERARLALGTLVRELRVFDEWREQNPNVKAFTYLHLNNGSQSRLDRIYVKRSKDREMGEWKIKESGLATDHRMVSACLYDRQAPFVGKGRWVMPKHLLSDVKMKEEMKRLAANMIRDMEAIVERTTECNAQTIYQTFKKDLGKAARSRAKEKVPKMQKQIEALREDLRATLNPPNGEPGEDGTEGEREEKRREHAAYLQDRLEKLEKRRFEVARKTVAAKQQMYQETMTKQWARS
ncbi:Endonuclease/exonuclease/phosphatase, partial [Cubamyces menziesii]